MPTASVIAVAFSSSGKKESKMFVVTRTFVQFRILANVIIEMKPEEKFVSTTYVFGILYLYFRILFACKFSYTRYLNLTSLEV